MPCKATIYQDRLGTTTQARLTQEEHFSQQQQNLRLKSAVLKAAARTKPAHPFLHCLEEDKWKNLRGFIISELSPKFLPPLSVTDSSKIKQGKVAYFHKVCIVVVEFRHRFCIVVA